METTINAFYLSWLITGGVSLLQGCFVYLKNAKSKLNFIWLLFNLCIFCCGLGFYLSGAATSKESALNSIRLLNIGAIFIPVLYMHFTYLLAGLDSEKQVELKCAYTATLGLAPFVFTKLFINDVVPKFNFKYWIDPGPVYFLFLLMFIVIVAHFHAVIFLRREKMVQAVRNQVNYVLAASIIGFAGGLTTFPMAFNIQCLPFGIFFIGLVPLIISYAIVKHRLMDISIIIRKTLVYSVVTTTLTAIYLVTVSAFANVFEGLAGYQTIFSSAIAAGLITLGFQPLRKRVQNFVDIKFFRQYVDREEKLYELSREVITHTTPEAMGDALMHVIDESLHPKRGVLYLRSSYGSGFDRVSSLNADKSPTHLDEDNILPVYFKDNPQPFVVDLSKEDGRSYGTRSKGDREDAA